MKKEIKFMTLLFFMMILAMGSTCSKVDDKKSLSSDETKIVDDSEEGEAQNLLPKEMTESTDEDVPEEEVDEESETVEIVPLESSETD